MRHILENVARKLASIKNSPTVRTGTLAIGIVLTTMPSHDLNAQQARPTERKGQTIKTVASLEAGAQIPELQGRYLRARMFTYEPGGNGLLHHHKELPVIL